MTCLQCGKTMATRRENVPYLSLPGTVLVGVEVRRCAGCGEYEVAIPAIDDLDRVLAHAVIEKPTRLAGAELRFLRKYLGYSSSDFAKLIGADKATVSRWESDAQVVGQQTDRLYRMLVVLDKKIDDYGIARLGDVSEGAAAKPRYAFKPTKKRERWQPTSLAH